MKLFNKTFFHFTFGFITILALSFALAVVVSTVKGPQQTADVSNAEPGE